MQQSLTAFVRDQTSKNLFCSSIICAQRDYSLSISTLDIGLMQGRLLPDRYGEIQSFPGSKWPTEFAIAKELGLSHIEWIYEKRNRDENPICSPEGIEKIKQVVISTGVGIVSVCADYFMESPYLKSNVDERRTLTEHLLWLVEQVHAVGGCYIDLPFVDNSSIPDSSYFSSVVEFLRPACERAKELGIVIALETDLAPSDFRQLLQMTRELSVAANYDSGNSAGIGYDFLKEMEAYGEFVQTVHLKDKSLNSPTMPLGAGDVDFIQLFTQLNLLRHSGPIVLQAARGSCSDRETICRYIEFAVAGFEEVKGVR